MRTILCVDDHRATIQTLYLILRTQGYCCITAETAEEAVRSFAANNVDLVILDYFLPEMNGSMLAAQLKRIRPVKVLMLSGSPDLNGKPESVDVLLAKPQHPTGLIVAVSALLGSLDDRCKETA